MPDKQTKTQDTAGESKDKRKADEREAVDDPPFWMWVIGVFGLLMVAGSIGFMLYEAVSGDNSPPDIAVEAETIQPIEHGFLVKIKVTNTGGSTAEGLTVEGQLENGNEIAESSNATIKYVPSHSVRHAGLFFTKDPQAYELQLRAKGYEKP